MKTNWTYLLIAVICVMAYGCSDPCKDVNCQNGGQCFDGSCSCPGEWTGESCEINKCDELNCQNGGECVNGACDCPQGYTGVACEFSIQSRLVGTWTAAQTCRLTGGTDESTSFTCNISAGENISEIAIALGAAGTVKAVILDEKSFYIPAHITTAGNVGGGGTYISGSKMEINFSWNNSSVHRDCEVILTRHRFDPITSIILIVRKAVFKAHHRSHDVRR